MTSTQFAVMLLQEATEDERDRDELVDAYMSGGSNGVWDVLQEMAKEYFEVEGVEVIEVRDVPGIGESNILTKFGRKAVEIATRRFSQKTEKVLQQLSRW